MGVAAAQRLRINHFARRHLHQRRAREEDRPLLFHDDRLVRHRGHIRAPGGARTHDDRDLRDTFRRHVGLIVEDAAEMLAIREHLVLVRQVRPAAVDEVDAREAVLLGNFLRAQVLLDGHRVIRAAFDRRVVADDHHLAAFNPAHACDHARAGRGAVIHAMRSRRADFQKRRARVEKARDPVARQQLAALHMPVPGPFAAAQRRSLSRLADFGHRVQMRLPVRLESRITRREIGSQLHSSMS